MLTTVPSFAGCADFDEQPVPMPMPTLTDQLRYPFVRKASRSNRYNDMGISSSVVKTQIAVRPWTDRVHIRLRAGIAYMQGRS